MKLTSSHTILLCNMLLCSLFLGCGSGDDSEPTPTNTSTNSPPLVSIAGDNTVQEGQTLTLTANATDSDGSISSVKWSTTSTEISLSGDETSTVSFTAPDIDNDLTVTLDVLVTDNDGSTASQSFTITITRKVASVTLTGLVTDKIISNADVEITIGAQVFSATADENGVYTITITVDESLINQLVQLRALGDSNINPEVEFVSQLGSLSRLIEQAGSDGDLQKDENFGVNITNVTTAEYALFTRDGHTPISDVELSSAISAVNSDEKNLLAALIKIVVDNDDFGLPNGVSSTLELVSNSATVSAFEQDIIAQNPTLISENISAIVNDNSLTAESGIVGTWKVGTDVITFTRSGHYVHITTEVEDGSDNKLGYEIGSYSWNKSTGSLSFTTKEDSNGESGLHNEYEEPLNTLTVHAGTFIITDGSLTINEGDDVFNASRLVSDSNPFVGGFYLQQTDFSDDFSMLITVDDNKAVLLYRLDSSGLPEGISYLYMLREYSYDATSSLRIVHSQKVYVDGNIASEKTVEVWRALIKVQGDVISMTRSSGTSFLKNSYTTTTQDYLTDKDIIGNFSGTHDEVDFNATFNADGTGKTSSVEGDSSFVWKISFGQLLLTLNEGATQIWSPSSLASDVWPFNVTQYNNAGDFESSSVGTLTFSDDVVLIPVESSIEGTWSSKGAGGTFSVTFTSDGRYVHMQQDNPTDDCGSAGFEVGTYVWNQSTGVVTATTSEDTNGCVGLNHETLLNTPFELDETIQVVGTTLVITQPSGEVGNFNRIISDTNPIVGAYLEGDFDNEFFLIVFEEDGTFMELAHDSDELGLTAGTYNWDPSTTLFDYTAITLSQWGSNPDQIIISAQGDILIWKDGEDAGVMKRTHKSTEQPYLTDINQVVGSFTGIADENFGFQATLNNDFTGVVTDDDGTFGFEWSINFGQLIVDYGDEISILSPTAIAPNTLEFNVAEFDLIDTFDGNEVGQVDYYSNTWTRN